MPKLVSSVRVEICGTLSVPPVAMDYCKAYVFVYIRLLLNVNFCGSWNLMAVGICNMSTKVISRILAC